MSLGQIIYPLEMRSDDLLESVEMSERSKLYVISCGTEIPKADKIRKVFWISEENPRPIAVVPVVAN